ncbi:hypothetical protein ILUMI_09085, partial [Ignelater luminosus]
VCDSNLKIININAHYPGNTNDSFIWSNSNAQHVLRNLYKQGHSGYYVLGNSGYPLRPWCLKPLENNSGPDTPEEAYNIRHKNKKFNREVIINACVVLHMCIDQNEPHPEDEDEGNDIDLDLID